MKPEKQIKQNIVRLVGQRGLSLPFLYDGKMIRVTSEQALELDEDKIPYESKIHIERALKEGALKKVQGEDKK